RGVILLRYEQGVSPLEDRRGMAASALGCRLRPCGSPRSSGSRPGERGTRSFSDHGGLYRGEGLSALSPGDDGGAVAVCLSKRHLWPEVTNWPPGTHKRTKLERPEPRSLRINRLYRSGRLAVRRNR